MIKIKKINKIPTVMVLLIFSWLIAIFGLATGICLIILKPGEIKSLLIAFSILLGSILLAVVIRIFGNIGQMIFDLKGFIHVFYQSLSHDLQALDQGLKTLSHDTQQTKEAISELNQSLSHDLQALDQGLKTLSHDTQQTKDAIEQISCDSKDISQNIHQITTFFEKIERHLDLKK